MTNDEAAHLERRECFDGVGELGSAGMTKWCWFCHRTLRHGGQAASGASRNLSNTKQAAPSTLYASLG